MNRFLKEKDHEGFYYPFYMKKNILTPDLIGRNILKNDFDY